MTPPNRPRLWHIPISHFNEKARWALDLKGVEHDRRTPPPGPHMAIALWLTRGAWQTFPVLEIDGTGIGDSTAIIAALERRYPDPPLYPADPAERRRALELEEFFDEELGPYSRLLAFHFVSRDPDAVEGITLGMVPGFVARQPLLRRVATRAALSFVELRYRVSGEEEAEHARVKVLAALDRLERELEAGGGEYLVGDAFSVADLTAASLFGPVVIPPEGPILPDPPAAYAEFRDPLRERPGYRWVEGIFARHRRDARRP